MTIDAYRRFLIVSLALGLSGSIPLGPAAADVGSLRAWSTLSAGQSISPATGGPADHVVDWVGPNGKRVHLVVRVPVAAHQEQVVTLSPGGGNAGQMISAALTRVARGGIVRLMPGVYRIAGDENWRDPALLLSGLSDVTISGSGATLLFTRPGNGIRIANSNRVMITGVTLRYADPAMVVGRIARSGGLDVGASGAHASQLQIFQGSVFDSTSSSYPPGGARILLGKGGTLLTHAGDGRLGAGPFAQITTGNTVVLKLGYYMGAVISVLDSGPSEGSSDIVLDHIAIENGRGMGISVGRMNRGLAFINSRIGPANLADLPDSIAYDGVHVTAASGDILIQNNIIQGTGDDGINLASPILDAAGSGSASSISVKSSEAVRAGDQLGLFDSDLNFIGAAAVTGRSPTDATGMSQVQLTGSTGAERVRYVRNLRFIGSRYAVVDNTIGHCMCHGALIQGPNGLVANNHFNYLRYNAIRLLTSGAWHEGSGVENVLVTNNQISNTGEEIRGGFPWAAIMVYGEVAGKKPAPGPLAGDIAITGNTITNVANGCVSVQNAVHVAVSGNRCGRILGGPAVMVDPGTTQDVRTTG